MANLSKALFVGVAIVAQIGYLATSRAQMSEKRFFTVAAVELRGGINVAQEPLSFPKIPSSRVGNLSGNLRMLRRDARLNSIARCSLFQPIQVAAAA